MPVPDLPITARVISTAQSRRSAMLPWLRQLSSAPQTNLASEGSPAMLLKHHSIPASTFLPPQSHPTPTAPIPASPKHSLSLHLCAAECYPRCCQLFPLRSFQILLLRAVLINRNTHSKNLLDSSPPCWVYFQKTCGKLRTPTRTRPSHGETSPSCLRRFLVPLHPGLGGLEETPSRVSALLASP